MNDLWQVVLIAGAGFLAGAINAVAGGGLLVSFPALLAVGFPAVTANVTNAVAMLPATLADRSPTGRSSKGKRGASGGSRS